VHKQHYTAFYGLVSITKTSKADKHP